jgi:hypothetical protein
MFIAGSPLSGEPRDPDDERLLERAGMPSQRRVRASACQRRGRRSAKGSACTACTASPRTPAIGVLVLDRDRQPSPSHPFPSSCRTPGRPTAAARPRPFAPGAVKNVAVRQLKPGMARPRRPELIPSGLTGLDLGAADALDHSVPRADHRDGDTLAEARHRDQRQQRQNVQRSPVFQGAGGWPWAAPQRGGGAPFARPGRTRRRPTRLLAHGGKRRSRRDKGLDQHVPLWHSGTRFGAGMLKVARTSGLKVRIQVPQPDCHAR